MEFTHPLPSRFCEGKENGTYNNPELEYPGLLTTTDARLGLFMKGLRDTVRNERRMLMIDEKVLVCCNNWIRDCYYMFEVFKHWEYDNHSFFDFLLENQTEKGFFFELVKQMDDRHWAMVDEECRRFFPEDNLSAVRLELEADVEYIMVLYARTLYKVNGDLTYIRRILPALEKGIDYMTSDPKRWDSKRGLVIRPYTIDTWDFTNEPESSNDRRIYPDRMCAMHGDNSGVFAAMKVLEEFNRLSGNEEKAEDWKNRAEKLRENTFRYLWNGRFFIHQLPITCAPHDDKENERLSLSNPYDINRGFTDTAQSRSIIEEYMRRRETTDAFCECFSIDPPYPKFKEYPAGMYVNGAVSPFTAGELALAALNNGYEAYGYDIIRRFMELWEKDGRICFLYARSGEPVSITAGPSGWGAAALLKAVEEGLAGIRDEGTQFGALSFSPRWAVTEYKELRYITGYEKTHIHVDVRYELTETQLHILLICPAKTVKAHILLPKGKTCAAASLNGSPVGFINTDFYGSPYADIVFTGQPRDKAELILTLL